MKYEGSCLCGRIKIEVTGEIELVSHCHCKMCQKAHGAPYGTFAVCKNEYLKLIADDSDIGRYQSSADIQRTFCANCGSNLQWVSESEIEKGWASFALSLLDTPINPSKQKHIFTSAKAPWYTFCDDHPKAAKF